MLAAAAVAAELSAPDGIELLDERVEKGGVVCEDAVPSPAARSRR